MPPLRSFISGTGVRREDVLRHLGRYPAHRHPAEHSRPFNKPIRNFGPGTIFSREPISD